MSQRGGTVVCRSLMACLVVVNMSLCERVVTALHAANTAPARQVEKAERLALRGRPCLAAQQLEEALLRDPRAVEYHLALAAVYGSYPEAIMKAKGWGQAELFTALLREYGAARTLQPEDIGVAIRYAWYAQNAEGYEIEPDLERAANAWRYCLQRMLESDQPARPGQDDLLHILMNLGRIELKRGRETEARACFAKAADTYPWSSAANRLTSLERARCAPAASAEVE